MAVPKKRTSKAKKNARKANWKERIHKAQEVSLAKSMLVVKLLVLYTVYIDEE
jgi:ribosomal protein L32